MAFKAGQQVCLLFSREVTGTVSRVHDGTVSVTWNRPDRGRPRIRRAYPASVAQRVLAQAQHG